MRLRFDRGTLLLADDSTSSLASTLPGALWDSRVSSYRCPAYLHASIVAWLRERRVRFVDEVPPPGRLDPVASPELRPYQEAALSAWNLAGRKGVIVLPTGSGKTRVALAAIARTGTTALCLVPTRVLLEQWGDEIRSQLGIEPGRYGDGRREVGPITVATFESAWRHMGVLGDRFGLLVIDEVHHFGNGLRDEALEMCGAPFRMGLTATPPPAESGVRIEALVGRTIFELGLRTLAGTYLAPFEAITLHVELDPAEREEYGRMRGLFRAVYAQFRRFHPTGEWADFAREAARSDEGRRALVAFQRMRAITAFPSAKRAALALLLARHQADRTLVFTGDNATAYAVSRMHLLMPFTCDIGRAERTKALDHFRAGRLRALVSAQVLNEGLDVPDAEVGIVVAGRRGEREHVQRVGRLLRPRPGKRAVIYALVVRGTREERDAVARRQSLMV